MLASQRTRLIERGLNIGKTLHPATIIFTGFPASPVEIVRKSQASTAELGEGAFEGSEPQTFWILAADLPGGLVIKPKKTTFNIGAKTYRVSTADRDPGDPHVRITADIPSANGASSR